MTICVVRKKDGKILVRAGNPGQVTEIGGTWYFHPDIVELDGLEQSGRTYHCPLKGTCNWIDLVTGKGVIVDFSWVYPEPKQQYKHIGGWYGFYTDHRYYETKECE